MGKDRTEILNEIYQFAEHFDAGRFDAALNQFEYGKFLLAQGRLLNPKEMADVWRQSLLLHKGLPCTRHVVTNPILKIDKVAGRAWCRSVYTVYQSTETLPLQMILCGRYHDKFLKRDGAWRFAERDYRLVDMVGDVSQHLRPDMAKTVHVRSSGLEIVNE